MTSVLVRRAGPLTTIQDHGRVGVLRHGISASGPMDGASYRVAGSLAGQGRGGIEFTLSGIEIEVDGACRVAWAGGAFRASLNGVPQDWPGAAQLAAGDVLTILPGPSGNYGYLRFDAGIALPPVMRSLATSSRVGLGGLDGRSLRAGDIVPLTGSASALPLTVEPQVAVTGPLRVVWGIHADRFESSLRQRVVNEVFVVSPRLDRMGVRLDDPQGVFTGAGTLSLVSDAMVPGDIQILGDGTPIVLMRDHQPTGGYPRIATIVTADLDRFAQMRPGTIVAFEPVTVEHAHRLLRGMS